MEQIVQPLSDTTSLDSVGLKAAAPLQTAGEWSRHVDSWRLTDGGSWE